LFLNAIYKKIVFLNSFLIKCEFEMSEKRIFAIGDIHGCYKTFYHLLNNILCINKDDDIFLLGDYIDRGPRVKQTVDYILELIEDGYNVFPVKGNHEEVLLEALDPDDIYRLWMNNYASATLESFNIKSPFEFDKKYITFFKSLKYYYILDNFIIVHGGLNFRIDDPFSDFKAMVWERNSYVDMQKTGGRRLITGHTPTTLENIKYTLNTNRILLDGGCVYNESYREMGNLCALELNSFKLFYQQNIED